MKCARTFLAVTTLLLVGSWVSPVAWAVPANPYNTVVTRNIFGLVPIPTNPPVDPTPIEPPIKITPNGIMSIFGKVQVLFKTPGKAKAGQPAKEESYVMSAGERQDEIEVVSINEKEGKVTFNNHGVTQELALVAAANVPAPVISGPAGALPGMAAPGMAVPGGMVPMPGGVNNAVGGGRFGRSTRGKNVTSSEDLAAASANFGGNGGLGAAGVGNNSAQNLSPEAQVIMIEANRAATQQAVNQGLMPPLPPTVLTPSDATAHGGTPLIVNPGTPAAPQ